MTYSDSEESYNSYDDDDYGEDYFSCVDDEGDECSDGMDEDESCQSDGDVGGDVVSDDEGYAASRREKR